MSRRPIRIEPKHLLLALVTASGCFNNAPHAPSVAISPIAPRSDEDLGAVLLSASVDPESTDEVEYRYEWYQNDVLREDLSEINVPAEETVKGETWRLKVLPFDGKDEGASDSASVTILNSPPVLTASALDDTPSQDDDLTVIATANDVDDDPIDFTYTWTRNGETTAFTADTVPASSTDNGDLWQATIIAYDDEEAGESATVSISVDNWAPVVSSVTLIPSVPTEESILSASVEWSDHDGDLVTLYYVWTVNDERVNALDSEQSEINGDWFNKDDQVSVTVTPFDGLVSGESVSDNVIVMNTPPSILNATIEVMDGDEQGTVTESATLMCEGSGWSDVDDDDEGYQVVWLVNEAVVSSDSVLTGAHFSKGDQVACILAPDDGDTLGETIQTDATTVDNSPPTITETSISPSNPTGEDDLTAVVTVEDDDGDTIDVDYSWSVNGQVLSTTETLASAYFERGDTIILDAVPSDDEEEGDAGSSGPTTVENAPPEVSSVSLSTYVLGTDDAVSATATATDADGDDTTISFTWMVDGTPVTTGDTLEGSEHFDKNQQVWVEAVANDGTEDGDAFASTTITVDNTAPSADSASLSPTEFHKDSTVTCVVSGWSDLDGDDEGYTYTWSVNGSTVAETSSDIDGTYFDRDDAIACIATPDDGDDQGTPVSSDSATAGNAPAHVIALTLSSDAPIHDEEISVEVDASDSDGDDFTIAYMWYVNDQEITETSFMESVYFVKDDEIFVEVTVTDEFGEGEMVTSDVILGGNNPPEALEITFEDENFATDDIIIVDSDATDYDGDPISFTYIWTVNGTVVSETSDTLDGTIHFDRDDEITVAVIPNDGEDDGEPFESDQEVTILNTAPEPPSVSISPEGVTDMRCEMDSGSTDSDGDSISYTFGWTVDGQTYEDAIMTHYKGDTVPASDTLAAEEWACSVTPNDGTDDGENATITATIEAYMEVTIGTLHSCSLNTMSGELECWGSDDDGLISDMPTGQFVQTSGPYYTACAVDADGTTTCWGDDTAYQVTDTPTEPLLVTAPGAFHVCAIDESESIQCWGNDAYNQVSDAPTGEFVWTESGYRHSCAMDADGLVQCWGFDSYSQIEHTPTDPVLDFSAGSNHNCAIDNEQELVCWGRDVEDQVTDAPRGTFIQVSSGNYFSCAVDTENEVSCWGDDDYGQVSDVPTGLFTSVSAATYHVCAVGVDEEVTCWGNDLHGQASPP